MTPATDDVSGQLSRLRDMDTKTLRKYWQQHYRTPPPPSISRDLMLRAVAFKVQERAEGGLTNRAKRILKSSTAALVNHGKRAFDPGITLKTGAKLLREWRGHTYRVVVLEDGFEYYGRRYASLTQIAREITGTHWSGPRFFGLKKPSPPFASLA